MKEESEKASLKLNIKKNQDQGYGECGRVLYCCLDTSVGEWIGVHGSRMLLLSQMHLTPCYWRRREIILYPMAQRKMIMNIACLSI